MTEQHIAQEPAQAGDSEQHEHYAAELSPGVTIAKLEKLARGAARGTWQRNKTGHIFAGNDRVAECPPCQGHRGERNAKYIAAARPETVLALIDRLRKAESSYPTPHAYEAACAALHKQRERADQAEAREQALAAHLGRLEHGGRALYHELEQWALTERDPETSSAMSAWMAVARDRPATSLARRDAEKQAEAMSEALDALEYMDREVGSDRGALDATRDELRERIRAYRCQAEQADTDGEES
ncbi:hypothetical protein [Halomonas getboli]|uniref:hypothetical protein n=1 Tax=Halomonas getboli TaxID=2935862 RepID=UPI001FFF3A30|nr:hypothetical protein [Halomonas getboli]MCK2183549.1 hypothetical protein [Halomonas getboli]